MKNNYLSLFIEIGKYSVATILIVAAGVTSATIASSKVAKIASEPIFAKSVQLSIQSPRMNFCPSAGKMTGWIQTNKPGELNYRIAKRDGTVSDFFPLVAAKSINGGVANFSQDIAINESINSEYQVVVYSPNSKVASEWVTLKANCNIRLHG